MRSSGVFLPGRLRELYGRHALNIFYPEIFETDRYITYRDVIELYQHCMNNNDAEALAVLSEAYDINEIMKFDSEYCAERSINKDHTRKELTMQCVRKVGQRLRGYKTHRLGSKIFAHMFRRLPDGGVIFNARACVYSMTGDQMRQLFKLSDFDPHLPSSTMLPEMFETMCKLPDRNKLILFYLRFMCNQMFPIEDWQPLSDGTYKIVDHF